MWRSAKAALSCPGRRSGRQRRQHSENARPSSQLGARIGSFFLAINLIAALGLLAGACDVDPNAAGLPLAPALDEPPDPLVYRSRQLSFRLQSALKRLEEPMPPATEFRTQACPDAEILARTPGEPARTLVLNTHDSRYGAHSLLPLRLTQHLETRQERRVASFFESSAGASISPLARLVRSEAHAQAAEHELRALEAQTYKGVFHLTQFKKAHLIRKKNKRAREWTKGVVSAWLVVYDIDTSESLCQAQVISVNDVDDEPTSIRLRPETGRRLVRELGEQLRMRAGEALASVSRVLKMPTPLGDDS